MENFSLIVLILFAMRVIRALFFNDGDFVATGLGNAGLLSWWDETWSAIAYDYTCGKHRLYKWLITITGVVVALVWLIKGIIYLLTSRWFWIAMAILAACLLIFFSVKLGLLMAEKINSSRQAKLADKCRHYEEKLKEQYGIPVPEGALSTKADIDYSSKFMENFDWIQKKIDDSQDAAERNEARMQLADSKLRVFFTIGVGTQFLSLSSNGIDCLGKWQILQKNLLDDNLLALRRPYPVKYDRELMSLENQIALLQDNRMDKYLSELEEVKDMDTGRFGGLVTNLSKLTHKTDLLKSIYEAARDEYEELHQVLDDVSQKLHMARVKAYEDIYLGIEMLSLVRDNVGGKTLKMIQESLGVESVGESVDYSPGNREVSFANIATNTLSSFVDSLENDDVFLDNVCNNPKQTAATLLFSTAFEYLGQRNDAIQSNNRVQKQIIEGLPEIIDAYQEGQATMLRAIEITKALCKANTAFFAIYSPLFEKVFVEKDVNSVSINDIQQLALAISEYNKISKSTLQ